MTFLSRFFRGKYNTISGSKLDNFLNNDNILILDVRRVEEFRSGHIPNAKNIPVGELSSRLSELNSYKNSKILVYCAAGSRSARAADILVKNGFNDVYNLSGGISSYKGKLNR